MGFSCKTSRRACRCSPGTRDYGFVHFVEAVDVEGQVEDFRVERAVCFNRCEHNLVQQSPRQHSRQIWLRNTEHFGQIQNMILGDLLMSAQQCVARPPVAATDLKDARTVAIESTLDEARL